MQATDADFGTAYAPVFDYRLIAEAKGMPDSVLSAIEKEAETEFPQDPMMMELHILRAVKRYD
jgi:hypothetical protein